MVIERNKNVPSTYIIPMRGNRVLLQRRCNTGFEDGNYGLVAGHVEEGETFTQGIIREAEEEVGMKLKAEDMEVVHVMHRRKGDERIDVFFKATKWGGEIKNLEPHKCDDLDWFYLDNLPENTIDYIKVALENMQKGIIYDEHGWE